MALGIPLSSALIAPVLRQLGYTPETVIARTFGQWKRELLRLQKEADILCLPANGAIRGWDAAQAGACEMVE